MTNKPALDCFLGTENGLQLDHVGQGWQVRQVRLSFFLIQLPCPKF